MNFIAADRPYLKGKTDLESLPHLIIVPGTLRAQWVHELETFFRPKSVDILLYDCPKTGNSQFWSPTGPFHSSRQSLHDIIIVTTHSVSNTQFISISKIKWIYSGLTKRDATLLFIETHEGFKPLGSSGKEDPTSHRIFIQRVLHGRGPR